MANTRNESRILLRVPEVGNALGLSRTAVYELINAGELPVVRVGRAVRIPRRALEEWAVEREERVGYDQTQ